VRSSTGPSTSGRIAAWSPASTTPLLHAVRDAFVTPAPLTAVGVLNAHEPALKRWLSARLFGNWIAYQGDGLQAIVRYLQGCLATFTTELARDGSPLEAIRRSDLLIVHNA